MSIVKEELKLYLSEVVDNSTNNGGYMSNTLLDTIDTENNLWPNVLKEERSSGSTRYTKLFCKQENTAGEKLFSAQVWLDKPTAGQDYITIFTGTQSDTQASINPTRVYGVVTLSAQAQASSNTFSVLVENTALLSGATWPIIQSGDSIRITDKADPDIATPGNEEWLIVDTVTNTTGLGMTITTTSTTANIFNIGSRISSLVNLGDIKANISDVAITSTLGTCAQANISISNVGTIEDTITCTIKADGISFTVNSARLGALADGTFAANYTLNNPNFSGYYYVQINSSVWGGTWTQNDTLVFKTHPAAASIWQKRVVPPGCTAQSNNATAIAFNGQSL